jgi:hypothetical protein
MATPKIMQGVIETIATIDPIERYFLKLLRRPSYKFRHCIFVYAYQEQPARTIPERLRYFFSNRFIGLYKLEDARDFYIGQKVRVEVAGERILSVESLDNAAL